MDHSRATSVRRPAIAGVLGLCGLFCLLEAPLASASDQTLRPVADLKRQWAPTGANFAWSALNDAVTPAGGDFNAGRLDRKGAGRVTRVKLAQPTLAPDETPSAGRTWFHAATGKATRLQVRVLWDGKVRATRTLAPRTQTGWRAIEGAPSDSAAANTLQLRFERLTGHAATVDAAYLNLSSSSTRPVGPSTAKVNVSGSLRTIRPGAAVGTNAGPEAASSANLLVAKNEFESFQVTVEAGDKPLHAVTVGSAAPLSGPGGATIDPKNMTISREGLYTVRTPSSSAGGTGDWPDALIPERDSFYGENRNAFPVDLAAHGSVTAWIDLFIPPGTPAGTYGGSVQVSDANGAVRAVPVSVRVFGFTMPSTSSLKSMFLMTPPGIFPCTAHMAVDWCSPSNEKAWQLDYMYARAGLENRITVANPVPGAYQEAPAVAPFDKYIGPLVDGTDTGVAGTLAPRLQGAKLTSMTALWPCVNSSGCLSGWRSLAASHNFNNRFQAYVCDEPSLNTGSLTFDDWGDCSRNAVAAKAQWPGVKTLVTASAGEAQSAVSQGLINLTQNVDTLVPIINQLDDRTTGNQRSSYNDFLAGGSGKEVWSYTSCESYGCGDGDGPQGNGWPGYAIDQPAAQARGMGWLSFAYSVNGELYYNTMQSLDTAFSDQYTAGANGDGNLFYPGSAAGYRGAPAIGGTHDIPLDSIRLKRIRDGREDYELLRALAAQGRRGEALNVLEGLFGPTDSAAFHSDFSQNKLTTARCTLANMLDSTVVCPSA